MDIIFFINSIILLAIENSLKMNGNLKNKNEKIEALKWATQSTTKEVKQKLTNQRQTTVQSAQKPTNCNIQMSETREEALTISFFFGKSNETERQNSRRRHGEEKLKILFVFCLFKENETFFSIRALNPDLVLQNIKKALIIIGRKYWIKFQKF